MLISRQVGRLAECTLLIASFILANPWQLSSGVASAFLVPRNSCRIIDNKVQSRCRSNRILVRQRLSLSSGTVETAATSPPSTDAEVDVKLSGKETVEQAAQRLLPLFAEVDAHTQR